MKIDILPVYQEVVFLDTGTGDKFLCRSSVQTHDTVEFEGTVYPCFKVSISSKSHPFYTGEQGIVDTEGRVDKFRKRYAKPVALPKEEVVAPAEKEVAPAKAKKPAAKAKKSAE